MNKSSTTESQVESPRRPLNPKPHPQRASLVDRAAAGGTVRAASFTSLLLVFFAVGSAQPAATAAAAAAALCSTQRHNSGLQAS